MAIAGIKRLFSKTESDDAQGSLSAKNSSLRPSLSALNHAVLMNLYNASGHKPKNSVFSPFSVIVAIAMLAGGAEPSAQNEILAEIGLSDDAHRAALVELVTVASKSSSLGIGNAAFIDKTVELYDEYKSYLEQWNAGIIQYPKLATSVKDINKWISDNTQGMIQDMLSTKTLEQSHMVLINAIAFKQSWQNTFNTKFTSDEIFYVTSDTLERVKMMHLYKKEILVRETSKYAAVEMPYAPSEDSPDTATSMRAYLPEHGVTIPQVLEAINNEAQKGSAPEFKSVKYDRLSFPKFEVTDAFSVKAVLSQLGYLGTGQFPKICAGQNEVQEVLHQAYVKVDEQGTTAAAATAVVLTRSRPQKLRSLDFTRPFVFTIVRHDPDIILFAGVFRTPKSG